MLSCLDGGFSLRFHIQALCRFDLASLVAFEAMPLALQTHTMIKELDMPFN